MAEEIKEKQENKDTLPDTPEELRKTLSALYKYRLIMTVLMAVIIVPVSAGLFGGAFGGLFALLCLIIPVWWVAIAMGCVGAIGGTVIGVYITVMVYQLTSKQITECRNKLNDVLQKQSNGNNAGK